MAKLVSTTYGDALFEVAVADNSTEAIYEEASLVINAFNDNEELSRLLNNPKIDKNEKKQVVEEIFSKFVSKDMTGLLVLMVEKQRHNDIISTLSYLKERIRQFNNIGTAYVTTAAPLTEAQKKSVVDRLLATTRYVKFEMNYSVDESIIGGMIIRIGDRVADSSIRHKLDELSRQLKGIQLA